MFYSPVTTNGSEASASDKLHLFKYVEDSEQYKLKTFESRGGYKAWKKVLAEMQPQQVIDQVAQLGVRSHARDHPAYQRRALC